MVSIAAVVLVPVSAAKDVPVAPVKPLESGAPVESDSCPIVRLNAPAEVKPIVPAPSCTAVMPCRAATFEPCRAVLICVRACAIVVAPKRHIQLLQTPARIDREGDLLA